MADVNNIAVTVKDLTDRVKFTTTLIHTGAATDNVWSQAIPMYGLQGEGAAIHFTAIGVTTRDVNLFLQGCMNTTPAEFQSFHTRERWDDFSADAADLNLISGPEVFLNAFVYESGNTTGVNVAPIIDPAFGCEFIRFQSSGETGNLVTSSTVITMILLKRAGFQDIPGGILPVDTA